MRLRRRQALAAVVVTALGLTPKVFGQTAAGNRKGSVRLIDRKAKAYRIPAWFQEGKFGIWATFGGRNRRSTMETGTRQRVHWPATVQVTPRSIRVSFESRATTSAECGRRISSAPLGLQELRLGDALNPQRDSVLAGCLGGQRYGQALCVLRKGQFAAVA
jgi:hypothetical protein